MHPFSESRSRRYTMHVRFYKGRSSGMGPGQGQRHKALSVVRDRIIGGTSPGKPSEYANLAH